MRSTPRLLLVSALAFLVACGGGGSTGGSSGGATASKPDADAVKKNVIEYFQKAVDTPGVTFEVTTLEDAEFPGWQKGNLQAKLGDQKQDVFFYITNDGKWLFRGEALDITVDPRDAIMQRISFDKEPSRGPADAKVTIVEWSDFECPFCGRAHDIVEKEVLPGYEGKVRFVFKQLPLTQIHPWAEPAAIATECAFQQGNDQFWKLYTALFTHQKDINKDNVWAKVEEYAKEAGDIDVAKLKSCYDARETLAAVEKDVKEAAEIGITSTPAFIINGRRVNGAQSAEAFKQIIDQELAGGKSS
jgi:protein-disulfide isomerase